MLRWWMITALMLVPTVSAYELADAAGDQASPNPDWLDIVAVRMAGNDTVHGEVVLTTVAPSDATWVLDLDLYQGQDRYAMGCSFPQVRCHMAVMVAGGTQREIPAVFTLDGSVLRWEAPLAALSPHEVVIDRVTGASRLMVGTNTNEVYAPSTADEVDGAVTWRFGNASQPAEGIMQEELDAGRVEDQVVPGLPLAWTLLVLAGVRR